MEAAIFRRQPLVFLSAKKESGGGTHLPEFLGVERRAEEEGLDLSSELSEILSKRRQGTGR